MLTLLDDRFAPTTESIGFLKAPLEVVARAYESWQREIYHRVDVVPFVEAFPEPLRRLEPLTVGAYPRAIWVRAGALWSAFFDCGWNGSDPGPAVRVLSDRLHVPGIVAMSATNTTQLRKATIKRYGAVQLWMFGPRPSDRRTIAAVNEGDRWSFDLYGHPQSFEELQAYEAKRVRDRFTSAMLQRYCRALGIEVFDANAYGPDGVWFETSDFIDRWSPPPVPGEEPFPPPPRVRIATVTLTQAQQRLGIVPGQAADLPG